MLSKLEQAAATTTINPAAAKVTARDDSLLMFMMGLRCGQKDTRKLRLNVRSIGMEA
jgi:hypothetical protein